MLGLEVKVFELSLNLSGYGPRTNNETISNKNQTLMIAAFQQ